MNAGAGAVKHGYQRDALIRLTAMLCDGQDVAPALAAQELGVSVRTIQRWLTWIGLIVPIAVTRQGQTIFYRREGW